MESSVAYTVKEPNPTGIPARWLHLLYRLAKLERGKVYTITLIVPTEDGDPQWAISGAAKVENGR